MPRQANSRLSMWLAALLCVAVPVLAPSVACAQVIVVVANGDAITSFDVEQRMKLLRVLRRPATREAAIEDMISDRIKAQEMKRYNVPISEQDITNAARREALALKMDAGNLARQIQAAGVTEAHLKSHWNIDAAFFLYIRSLYRSIEITENEMRAEIARRKGENKGVGTDYVVRQIVFVLPNNASPAVVQQRSREAEQLRAKFTNCEASLPYTRALSDVVVKEPVTRNSEGLGEAFSAILAKTPEGRLTAPERDPTGLVMIAVCEKKSGRDDTALREQITDELLSKKLDTVTRTETQKLRARAIIEKKG